MGNAQTKIAVGVGAGAVGYKATDSLLVGAGCAAVAGIAAVVLNPELLGLRNPKSAWQAWLELAEEDPIDTDIPIIDPHHHMWDFTEQPRDSTNPGARLPAWLAPALLRAGILAKVRGLAHGGAMLRTFSAWFPFAERFMGEQMHADMRGHRVRKTVHIECGWHPGAVPGAASEALRTVGETEMIQACADADPDGWPNGIVAHVDLTLGAEATEVALRAHAAAGKNFRGIRHSLARDNRTTTDGGGGGGGGGGLFVPSGDAPAEDDAAAWARFREGFGVLAAHGASYDCWLYHTNLPRLLELARGFPGTTVVVDHIALPLASAEAFAAGAGPQPDVVAAWRSGMAALAALPNVNVKLSGMGMSCMGFGFSSRPRPPSSDELARLWSPYVEFCIDQFGAERCMFASNFPVDKVSCSYNVCYNAFKKIVRHRPAQEKKQLFHDTAERVYRL